MAGTDASIRIKLGHLEVEYQGDASFLRKDLLETVKELLELQKQNRIVEQTLSEAGGHAGGGGNFGYSTDTIANILGAKKGPDLMIAAAAHLHFVKGKERFTRKEITVEMRTASGHWKNSYVANMTTNLNGLKSKDRLRQISQGTYALSNKERQALGARLAQAS